MNIRDTLEFVLMLPLLTLAALAGAVCGAFEAIKWRVSHVKEKKR